MKNLYEKKIPLQGRYIIEASAGTGKTYYIIILYIRLLLEKKLLPSQILVVTFTKESTQEIIHRVEDKIRSVIKDHKLGKIILVDEDYKHLKKSLLELDESSILTIHSFCKKVLSEFPLESRINMNFSMEIDTFNILQKVVEDFFRKNINKNRTNFEYLKAYKLHTPERFLDRNGLLNVIRSSHDIVVDIFSDVVNKKIIEKKQIFNNLEANKNFIFDNLVNNHKDKFKRIEEWQAIKNWAHNNKLSVMPKEVSIFINGTRYSRNVNKEKLVKIFEEIKYLKIKYLKINDLNNYTNQFDIAQFIKDSCLKIRKDFIKLKEQKGILDFDDLINKLFKIVKNSPNLVKNLQKQYPVAIIDEFQDTDSQQYEIFNTIYPFTIYNNCKLRQECFKYRDCIEMINQSQNSSNNALFMIGDPKQAIYGFRGGDIFTYLKAKNSCPKNNHLSMDINWRSTSDMIKAYNRLFYKEDYQIKDEGTIKSNIFSNGVGYQLVKKSSKSNAKVRYFKDSLTAINYFYYEVSVYDKKNNIDNELSIWTANEIIRLLNSKKILEDDIAILVQNSNQAKVIQRTLMNKNLNSVYLSQRDNVYHSDAAKEILFVMEGINELENKYLLKKALSTTILGGNVNKFIKYIYDDNRTLWDEVVERIKIFRMEWYKYGFVSLIMSLLYETFSFRFDVKERIITNILHLIDLIKKFENKYKHPNQLIKWYRQQIKNSSLEQSELRIESDDNLIKIVTIHGSKGLEYPVVFIPFPSYINSKNIYLNNVNKYYDKNLSKTVYKIDQCDNTKKIVEKEMIEESMRLFYVAVTRAQYRCYIGVAKYANSEKSSLAQFLEYDQNDSWLEKIQKITSNPDNKSSLLEVRNTKSLELNTINRIKSNYYDLKSNKISKLKDNAWEILSFSKISKTNIKNRVLDKENNNSLYNQLEGSQNELEFRFRAPKGVEIGNLLHKVLEYTDFSLGYINDYILQNQINKYRIFNSVDFKNLKKWLEECLFALIPQNNNFLKSVRNYNAENIKYSLSDKNSCNYDTEKNFRLKDIPNSKTLKEVEFYFPIRNNNFYKSNILSILEEYRNQSIKFDKISNYKIFGMFYGVIDLIFEYDNKFYVADYKSNYLGDKLDDYNQYSMYNNNQNNFYDLQYLIYSVALNKYLKQNLPNYNFEKDFGGVYYFYLRGMKNGNGVYQSIPSLEIINKLSNLLDGYSNV